MLSWLKQRKINCWVYKLEIFKEGTSLTMSVIPNLFEVILVLYETY